MTKLLLALIITGMLILVFNIPSNAQNNKRITIIVTKVDTINNTVTARRSYQTWKADCKSVDGYKIGDKLVAYFSKRNDSCNCYFRRIK